MAEDYGLKISTVGTPVKTATGENLVFTSGKNNFKTNDWQSSTITITGGVGSATIAHGKSFRPVALVFVAFAGGNIFLPSYVTGGLSYYYIDLTNLVITVNSPLSADGTQFTFYYTISETEEAD